jgi:sulfite reductase (NADPH) flavoprotein alpha-component
MANQKGKVILAGAGCGDPELLTLKAAKYLQQADVVITDRLVSQTILDTHVPKGVPIIYVGKQNLKSGSTSQEEINQLILEQALAGKLVVRLKGGDIAFFSNILDELATLIAHEIPYEMVPGITAASGASAYAGIPLTARGYSTSVRFLTNYTKDLSAETYQDLAKTNDTLVFYMSSTCLDHLVQQLLLNGIDATKELAVIEQATTPLQQVHICSLELFQEQLGHREFLSPSLVIIGSVVSLHHQFHWMHTATTTEHYFKPIKNRMESPPKITIAYGTETGNSKKLATDLVAIAKQKKLLTKLVSLDQYRLSDLVKEEYFVTVISTQGEGDPPPAAQKFYDHIHQNGFRLPQLKFSVLALGDTSYPLFCKAGEDVDSQLEKLGGKRIVPIQKCDLDYQVDAEHWFHKVLDQVFQVGQSNPVEQTKPTETVVKPSAKPAGKTIYQGEILTHFNLNDRGSKKETWHIEIAAEGLTYESGDSIGIVPKNDPTTVAAILSVTGIDGATEFTYKSLPSSLFELLDAKLNIANLSEKVLERIGAIIGQDLKGSSLDLLGVLQKFSIQSKETVEAILNVLIAQSPRLYTVSSSPAAQGEEVHITVARDIFWIGEEKKYGRCSDFLSKHQVGDQLSFFVQKNKRFKLPAQDRDVIMIGPGTGIAAFRGFLYEREAVGATGRNWLFFGEQHFATDFLYQTEIQNWFATGVLNKAELAFSRDQKDKIYVQHRIKEQGAELFQWLEGGAYVYICGKKDPMSTDVENALIEVIQTHGNKTEEAAKAYFNELKDNHRYHKDVY